MGNMKKFLNPLVMAALVLLLFAAPIRAAGIGSQMRFSFSGGIITSDDGDLASMIRGMDDYHQDLAVLYGLTKTGSWEWPTTGWSLGGEFEMDLSRRLSICLSLDFLTKSNKGSLRLIPEASWMSARGESRISACPLSICAVFWFPLGENIRAFLKGGPSYTWIRDKTEYRLESWTGWWEEKTAQIRDTALGLLGGGGIEYEISKMLSVTAECQARWTMFSSWTGEYDRVNSDGRSDHISGPVWFEEVMWITGKYYPEIVIGDKDVPHPTQSIRSFQVDFSGLAFKIGLKLRIPG